MQRTVFTKTKHVGYSVACLVQGNCQLRANYSTQLLAKSLFNETYNKPIESARSLPPYTYHDPKHWQTEQQNIFGREWFAVGHISEYNSLSIHTLNIGDQSYIISKDRQHKLHAFHNVCPHRGCQIVNKMLTNKRRITCPYHYWTFGLDGTLMAQPGLDKDDTLHRNHSERDPNEYKLKQIQLQVMEGIVWLNTQPNTHSAPPLENVFGDLLNEIRPYKLEEHRALKQATFDMDANWKIITENFLEWYHLPAVHRVLTTSSAIDNHDLFEGNGKFVCYVSDPLQDTGAAIDLHRVFHSNENIKKYQDRMWMIHFYPNITLVIHPTHAYIQFNFPQNADCTQQKFVLLQHPSCRFKEDSDGTFGEKVDEMWSYWNSVNDEDVLICDRIQKGIKSNGYNGGYYSSKYEIGTHKFHKMIIDSLCDP